VRLSRRASGFLLVVVAWTAFVWIVLVRNIARDHSHGTGFHVVHYVLAGIALTLDVGVLWIAVRGWRGGGHRVRLETRSSYVRRR
jgi:hypothetical protein